MYHLMKIPIPIENEYYASSENFFFFFFYQNDIWGNNRKQLYTHDNKCNTTSHRYKDFKILCNNKGYKKMYLVAGKLTLQYDIKM